MQLNAFRDLFGRAPDFVDGHQHVQLYPQVRDGFLAAVKEKRAERLGAPGAAQPAARPAARLAQGAVARLSLSTQFRRRAARAGIAINPAFAGAYDFSRRPDFGALMRGFLDGLPEGGVVMCHPGFVDDVLLSASIR